MTLWQDLAIAEVVLGDVSSFVAGSPATISRKIGNVAVTDTVVQLPSGPAGTTYQVFSGSVWQIVGLVLADTAAAQAGGAVQIAEKIGNTWYGHTLSVTNA